MAKEDLGRFKYASKGKTGLIYVPSDVVRDSTFPFVENDQVLVKITNGGLLIEKVKRGTRKET